MRPYTLCLFLLLGSLGSVPATAQETVAETSGYQATSRHADVLAFGAELARQSPRIRLKEFGQSKEGRPLPLWVLADPPLATPEEARKSGKLVVLAFANIHAGEVDGKEAVLMLAREIARDADSPMLKKLVVLMVPNLNPDGNERVDRANRAEQNGPADGVGTRANADGYDLNRDFVKLETPEIRALVRLIRDWDPAVVVDMHTTNGSYHRYTLTYDGPRHPAAEPALVETVRDRWLPEISRRLEKETGFKSFDYGNFSGDRKAWESYPCQPRFGIQWLALQNRIGLLSESYSYATYKDRVLASRGYLRAILEYGAEQADQTRKLLEQADRPRERVALATKPASLGECRVLGFEEEMKDGKRVPTAKPRDYALTRMTGVEGTTLVQRPYAYLVPAGFTAARDTLLRHGIPVEELTEDREVECEQYTVEKLDRAARLFQKHALVTLAVTKKVVKQKVPAGTLIVKTEHRLGSLACFLLEPQSEDGLATWNFFDEGLKVGGEFPVLRVVRAIDLPGKKLPIPAD